LQEKRLKFQNRFSKGDYENTLPLKMKNCRIKEESKKTARFFRAVVRRKRSDGNDHFARSIPHFPSPFHYFIHNVNVYFFFSRKMTYFYPLRNLKEILKRRIHDQYG